SPSMVDNETNGKLGDDGEMVGLPTHSPDAERAESIPYQKPVKNRGPHNGRQNILSPRLSFEFTATLSLDSCIARLKKAWKPETKSHRPEWAMVSTVTSNSQNVARFEVRFGRYDSRSFSPVNPIVGQLERLENGDTLVKGEIRVTN